MDNFHFSFDRKTGQKERMICVRPAYFASPWKAAEREKRRDGSLLRNRIRTFFPDKTKKS